MDAADDRYGKAPERGGDPIAARPYRKTRTRDALRRQGPAADLAFAVDDFHRRFSREDLFEARTQALGHGANVGDTPREQSKHRHALGQAIGIEIEVQHRFERGEGQLVRTKRAPQRIAADACEQVRASNNDASLRAAQQLVTAKRYDVRALREGFSHRGFVRQPEPAQVGERAASQIDDER